MLLLFTLACTPESDSAEEDVPFTSDTVIEIVGTPLNECVDGVLHLQIGFSEQVPEVIAEVKASPDPVEFHTVPYGGLDKDTKTIHLYDAELDTEASEANAGNTTLSCDDGPYAGWRVYDDEGGIMACYFGEFVADQFDQTGCPTDDGDGSGQ